MFREEGDLKTLLSASWIFHAFPYQNPVTWKAAVWKLYEVHQTDSLPLHTISPAPTSDGNSKTFGPLAASSNSARWQLPPEIARALEYKVGDRSVLISFSTLHFTSRPNLTCCHEYIFFLPLVFCHFFSPPHQPFSLFLFLPWCNSFHSLIRTNGIAGRASNRQIIFCAFARRHFAVQITLHIARNL